MERNHYNTPQTDDVRIVEASPLISPAILIQELPVSPQVAHVVHDAREDYRRILEGEDDRLAVIVGPCSIHDPEAAIKYGERLADIRDKYSDALQLIMRVYFEKPRTTIGWKGLINDPFIDGSYKVNTGLRMARGLLLRLAEMGVPAATEFLDVITPQYICDLIAWGAIGARTTESQVHRELASGLSMPIGFKNGTSGSIQIAVDGIVAAKHRHCFLAVNKIGVSAIVSTMGNPLCHLILRGSSQGPNFSSEHVAKAWATQQKAGISNRIMIDCSHGNSHKKWQEQHLVAEDVARQLAAGEQHIGAVMIESNLFSGNQKCDPATRAGDDKKPPLQFGVSITDACVGWDETLAILDTLAQGVRTRRQAAAKA
ncbi:MAG: 3-deoxy-7-phosphoheptulonate synthase [Akkermansiaceae bacterium]|nr:3-deoxy-7-phosphoheptulonate synthase [Akkermansiaceae bacterium]